MLTPSMSGNVHATKVGDHVEMVIDTMQRLSKYVHPAQLRTVYDSYAMSKMGFGASAYVDRPASNSHNAQGKPKDINVDAEGNLVDASCPPRPAARSANRSQGLTAVSAASTLTPPPAGLR